MTFDEDAKLHNALNNFVLDLIYNKYNETLWDVEMLNHMDREELGEQFASGYVKHYANEFEENKDSIEHLSVYAAKEIDRLIPRLYFLEKITRYAKSIRRCLPAASTMLRVRTDFKLQKECSTNLTMTSAMNRE